MASTVPEASVEPLVDAEGGDAERRLVHMGRLRLAPGARFAAPTSRCQEVLAYVEEGAVVASGEGIGERRALGVGSALRFGPEAGGRIDNASDEGAIVFLAFVRAAATPFVAGPDLATSLREPPVDEACGERAAAAERVSAGVEPLVLAGGDLRVSLLLDEAGQGAALGALSLLEAAPTMVVPEHVHETSAEVLFITQASGSMRYGDGRIPVAGPLSVYIPAGLLHDFQGDGTQPLRAFQVYAPAGPEQRFRTMAAAATPETE